MTVFSLKLVGVGCMLLDHLAVVLSTLLPYPVFTAMRVIGRLSFPIFAFLIANGCRHTHSPRRYLLRLLACGLLSQLAYTRALDAPELNIMFDLAAGVAGIFLFERCRAKHRVLGVLGFMAIGVVSGFLGYGPLGFVLMLLFYFIADKGKATALAAVVLALLYLPSVGLLAGALAALALLWAYNGQLGYHAKATQFAFYLIYPLHLFLYWGLRAVLLTS